VLLGEEDHAQIRALHRLSQPRYRLGVLVGLDQVRTKQVEEKPVPLRKISAAAVDRDPDHERSGCREDHRHLVFHL
jgi:hypothetical protein